MGLRMELLPGGFRQQKLQALLCRCVSLHRAFCVSFPFLTTSLLPSPNASFSFRGSIGPPPASPRPPLSLSVQLPTERDEVGACQCLYLYLKLLQLLDRAFHSLFLS